MEKYTVDPKIIGAVYQCPVTSLIFFVLVLSFQGYKQKFVTDCTSLTLFSVKWPCFLCFLWRTKAVTIRHVFKVCSLREPYCRKPQFSP